MSLCYLLFIDGSLGCERLCSFLRHYAGSCHSLVGLEWKDKAGMSSSWGILMPEEQDGYSMPSSQWVPSPHRYPVNASGVKCLRYHTKLMRSMPMATTPAAEPMMSRLPPVPAQ